MPLRRSLHFMTNVLCEGKGLPRNATLLLQNRNYQVIPHVFDMSSPAHWRCPYFEKKLLCAFFSLYTLKFYLLARTERYQSMTVHLSLFDICFH